MDRHQDRHQVARSLRGVDTSGMSRRQVMSLAAMAALAAPLSACAGDQRTRRTDKAGGSGTAAPVDSERPGNDVYPYDAARKLFDSLEWPGTDVPEPKSKVRVTLAITSDENLEVRHAQFAKFFSERHPNIEIRREVTPWDDFLTKYMTQAAGGSLPDLMYSHYSWAQSLISHRILAPLDDFIASTPAFDEQDFKPEALGYWERGGRQYGIPTDSAPKMLFYNKEIFAKAGVKPPDKSWTWEKVRDVAVDLTKGKGVDKTFGFTPMPVPFPDLTTIYLLPYGARFLSPDESRVMIHEPAARDALAPWLELEQKHGAVPSLAEMQALEDADPYRANHAAMAVNGVWILTSLIALPEHDRFEWGMTHLPSGPEGRFTPVVGSAFGLTRKAAQPEAAWIVLNNFLSAAGHRFFLLTPPARLSTFEQNLDALQIDSGVTTVAKEALQEYGTSDGVLRLPTAQKIVDTATPIWDRVRSGKLTLSDGLRQIKDRIGPIAAENG